MRYTLRAVGGVVPFIAVLMMAHPAHGTVVLSDTLQGSTTGTRSGGAFVAGGWQVGFQYDSIYWHVPTMNHGAFEYNVTGIAGGLSGCPGGDGFKSELSHMYDYTFNNADNQYAPGYQNDPYKQFIRKQCESGKTDTMEIVWQVLPNFGEDDTGALSWSAGTTYLFRNEWENIGGNANCKTYRNGSLILNQTVTGNWTPAGQSVRIAASTRQANEGAITGSIYSNVKVEDLAGAPGQPTVVAPTNGETVNTTVVYIQWTGSSHTLYQVQINSQNQPDTAIVYDSQQVSSTRSFAWTGTLSNLTTYYVFVREGSGGGWGPWSPNGRTFTVNTSFVPPGINYVKVKGNTLVNNSGPFLGLGFSHFRALQRCKYDRPRYQSDLAVMAARGFGYQRALTMVSWDDLEIAPVSFTNPASQFVPAWPDYAQQFKDAIDIAYDTYGIKTEVTIFADAQYVMPNDSTRMTHIDNILAYLVGREHKIVLIEVGNELFQNGLPDPNDVRAKGLYLANHTPIPIALSAPPDGSDAGIISYYGGSAADIATVHLERNINTNEGGWLPVRDSYRTGVSGIAPLSSNEPIGPGSSVNSENDPIKLCMAGCFAWTANLPSYVYHAKAGIQGWSGCCPPSGTEQFFVSQAGVDSYQNILPLLPKDLASWERNDGKVTASPFTNYSMGQANKWWTEVGGSTNGCVRNIAAIKGGEFVTCAIGILGGGLELEARRPMSIQVYNPLTGAVAYNLTKNTGEHFTLVQGPAAYVIKGIFTDIIGPTTEVFVDMGSPDVQQGLTNTQNGDGDTVSFTIGGRTGRKNVNPAEDYYFYFSVSDAFAYQGSKPDVYIVADYYDAGNFALTLQYDSTNGAFYQSGGSVTLTNTNTWKTKVWHVTDAYLGNRQNNGSDFRIGNVGNTFYLDLVLVTTVQPGAPVIAEVSPDPRTTFAGLPYSEQLVLTAGSPAPTWSVLQGPAGLQVNALGLVTGYTPTAGELGDHVINIQATNSQGSDTEIWTLRVLSLFDFNLDGDVDLSDFSHLQLCFSGSAVPYVAGCEDADSNDDGDVDIFDFNSFLPCMAGPNYVPGC